MLFYCYDIFRKLITVLIEGENMMFDLQNLIGVKSYSFRNIKDNCECARTIRNCQSCVVDLSGTHVNYDDPASWGKVLSDYAGNGVTIAGIGVVGMRNDETWNRRFFEFARQGNIPLISITFDPQDWEATVKLVEKLCEEYNITTAIHNHGGYNWLGNSTALKYVFAKCSKRIGLCLDTAWCIHTERENPVQWMDFFGDRMYGIHFKDFVWERNGKHVDSIVGEGSLDLPAVLERFKDLELIKSAVLEYEGPETEHCTAKSIANIRELYR